MAYVIFNLLCVAVLIGIDQGIKFWAVHELMPVGTLPLLLFMRFAVFNFADICVCVGVALWVLVIFLEELHSGDAKEP